MSSDSKRASEDYSEQLSRFESQLRNTMDDASLQQDVFKAIRELVRDYQESAADIRQVLLDRYEAGLIRKDTLHVVQRMLDKVATEYVDTMPEDNDEPDFGSTDVIRKTDLGNKDETDQLQAGSILRDRFLLQKRVSGGSMGVVFKALDRRLAEVEGVEPWVAIKVITPKLSRNAQALRAMQQEAAKGRCLTHPNIVRFIDLDRDDDLYFLIMEWIEGRSLAAILDDPAAGAVDFNTTCSIVRQLADALDYAHRCGVVHADVKPGNVMLTADGQVKLIDFGVARVRQEQADPSRFDPGVLGAATPAYSSMQVLTGEVPAPADDVFSLACLAYRMIAGHRVFGPRNAAEAAEAGMSPQRPHGLNDAQWRALRKALSFARVTRYASTREFAEDFLDPQELQAVAVQSAESNASAVETSERQRWPRAVAAGVVLAAAVAVVMTGGLPAGIGQWLAPLQGRNEVPATADVTGEPAPPPSPTLAPDDSPVVTAPPSIAGTADEAAAERQPVDEAAVASAGDPGASMPAGEPDAADSAANEEAEAAAVTATESTPERPRLPATHSLQLGRIDETGIQMLSVRLREDGPQAVIDLQRPEGLSGPLILVAEESRQGGNRSAWEAAQYRIPDDGIVAFNSDQSVSQLLISMTSDPVREADREVLLTLRQRGTNAELGLIELSLEDDDQRAFEASLPANAIGFAVSQVAAAENETAVQIDLIRYNPDETSVIVEYRVVDVTATQDEDYFATGSGSVEFAPGQRSARLLIPLVQDADVEADEAFFIELVAPATDTDAEIFRRIAVMIRDDDR